MVSARVTLTQHTFGPVKEFETFSSTVNFPGNLNYFSVNLLLLKIR